MKMTTEVPDGIATPDRLETRIGVLTSNDGVPDKETVRKIYDNLDFQHGVQAFLSGIQIASMHALREGHPRIRPPQHHGRALRGPHGLEGAVAHAEYHERVHGHVASR